MKENQIKFYYLFQILNYQYFFSSIRSVQK
jgi:hypothetical protein